LGEAASLAGAGLVAESWLGEFPAAWPNAGEALKVVNASSRTATETGHPEIFMGPPPD
jgi:hypothetical protein